MHDAHEFLTALAAVLCVAAVTTVVCQLLRQPVVLGYMIAGLIVGPHVPLPLVADLGVVQALSELGVILLMFSLGLEFSLRRMIRVGPSAGVTAVVECSLMVSLGFLTGRLLGWTIEESVFAGALVSISSTTIIVKAFEEQRVGGRLREFVLGVLVVEDLIAIVLLAVLTAVSSAQGVSADAIALTVGRLAAFLVGLVVVGLLVVPRAVRALNRLNRPETTLVASIGFSFAVALLAREFGYSVALGAFVAGSLVAESGEASRIEELVRPVRDVFAAVFFVAVGMLIDPAIVARHWPAIAALTAVVVVGKTASVSLGAFLTGNGTRTSVEAGMSLAQIGEFSFIIAGLGLSLGATGAFLYPVAVTVSAVTALLTSWLIRASGPAASWADRKAPKPIQTFAALYGTWIQRLRAAPREATVKSKVRHLVRLLLVDAAALAAIVVGASVWTGSIGDWVERTTGISAPVARVLVVAAAAALSAPFCVGIIRVARKLGATLAEMAFPAAGRGKADFAAAPRRALVVTLQIAGVLLVGAPVLAVSQPFLPGAYEAAALAALAAVLAVAFWRSATGLEGHVRAGAQMIVDTLAAQSAGREADHSPTLAGVQPLLAGLGAPVPVVLPPQSAAVGRTLADLNLRGVTGATVLAITRGESGVLVPTAKETLVAGDVLALAGTDEAVAAATALLREAVRPVAG
jgi:CPA2 family monovalent cation:H+ antiporter-2